MGPKSKFCALGKNKSCLKRLFLQIVQQIVLEFYTGLQNSTSAKKSIMKIFENINMVLLFVESHSFAHRGNMVE